MEENERRREEEKQNQIQDYTEIAWLKVLNQDLDKPQCPQIKLLKKWQNHQRCCCYEFEDETGKYYQYDWHWAMKEAKFRCLNVLSNEDWMKLKKELWSDWLKKLLNLKKLEDYKGYYNINTNDFLDVDEAYYWSSPSNFNCSYICNLSYFKDKVISFTDDEKHILSVRCFKD